MISSFERSFWKCAQYQLSAKEQPPATKLIKTFWQPLILLHHPLLSEILCYSNFSNRSRTFIMTFLSQFLLVEKKHIERLPGISILKDLVMQVWNSIKRTKGDDMGAHCCRSFPLSIRFWRFQFSHNWPFCKKNSMCVVTKTKVDEDGNMVFFHRETLIGLS